jgi:uncharacterized protein DUF3800
MSLNIFIDESGDLGWNFALPYREGGSSRYLTIGSLCIPPPKDHLARRIVWDLYNKFKWNTKKEKKWAEMSDSSRLEFAQSAKKLAETHDDIHFHAITVKKKNVMDHIRKDPNKLYNYMVRLSLLDRMSGHDSVTLMPDPRSIKVESGNSLEDYLQLELWFGRKVKTLIHTKTKYSHQCEEIQFVDFLSGVVRSFHEDGEKTNLDILGPRIRQIRLYFR